MSLDCTGNVTLCNVNKPKKGQELQVSNGVSVLPLAGRVVVVTGTVDGLSREEALAGVMTLGGVVAASVTLKVDLVVLGEGAGVSKEAKARGRGVAVMDGTMFAGLLADPTGWDGTPVGMTFAEFDEAHAPTGPSETVDDVGVFDASHRVGLVSLTVRDPVAGLVNQKRCWCSCGHRWLAVADDVWMAGMPVCPRPMVPVTVSPWDVSV